MSHHHDHGHDHSHGTPSFGRAFLLSVVANGGFVICQIIVAIIASSSSLLADAIHNLGDVLGLILAWIGNHLLQRLPTAKTTYGLKKMSILAALANGLLLVFSCGIIASDAIYKLFNPSEVQATAVMIVAFIGILINSGTAALFIGGKNDLNIRAAYLHLVYDALISLGVVISAISLYFTHWQWIDPLMGLLISVVILKGTWSLFRSSFQLIIDGVPATIHLPQVQDYLLAINGVKGIHDLHVWALSTQENALSVHLIMPESSLNDQQRHEITCQLNQQFGIQHSTIQIENNPKYCEDACKIR